MPMRPPSSFGCGDPARPRDQLRYRGPGRCSSNGLEHAGGATERWAGAILDCDAAACRLEGATMSHPDPNAPPATQPWRTGDELRNPVTRELAVLLDAPAGHARAEMTALVGSRVVGEHLH